MSSAPLPDTYVPHTYGPRDGMTSSKASCALREADAGTGFHREKPMKEKGRSRTGQGESSDQNEDVTNPLQAKGAMEQRTPTRGVPPGAERAQPLEHHRALSVTLGCQEKPASN